MHIKNIYSRLFILLILFTGCQQKKNYTQLVNVFVGTDFHGHTFPGATVPHGMVQLSPDTRTTTWDGCSGYHYSDQSIIGFSHIHFSGTGAGGGADIMLMPSVGAIQLTPGDPADSKSGYRSAFSHDQENASPGYYSVMLEDGIKAEVTASAHVGLHQYTFSQSGSGNIILDLTHGINDQVDSLVIQKISDSKIVGFRHAHRSLEGDRIIYFAAEFSRPFSSCGLYSNDQIQDNQQTVGSKTAKAVFSFDTKQTKDVMVKVAISKVDIAGAENNLKEISGWDFEAIREKARQLWNDELSKIEVEGGTEVQERTFYTALYHANIHPNINMDLDRRYCSTDHKIYTADGFDNYTTFSLWDTFRALHPLFTIIDQKRTNQYIRSFIERYQHFGNLPIMEFGGNEGFAMIGYHSLPVIADAWVKGIRDYDVDLAYEGMKKLSEGYRTGKDVYKNMGFIPYDNENQSVSKTLEYCYDDWCVSQLAKTYNEADFHFYSQKGQFYRNVFSPEAGFMRPKGNDYQWLTPFDPMKISGHYTEGNAFQYSTFVPHDLNSLIDLMGGDQKFENWLDTCFSKQNESGKADLQDVTGLIGQYAQGNEPSHNMAYLYNFVGKPWKTQQRVRQILETLYTDQPDGLCGNEDAGQMSAWFVLSSMGFYPVTPGLDYYTIGSPLFSKVTIHLENGKNFVVQAQNAGVQNKYIQSAALNGKAYTQSFLRHKEIMNGGDLVFTMAEKPNPEWGSKTEDRPKTTGYSSVAMPQIVSKEKSFLSTTEVSLVCEDNNAVIRYTTDGSDPNESSLLYSNPIVVTETSILKARSYIKDKNPSYPATMNFEKLSVQPAMEVKNPQSGLKYEYLEGYCMSVSDMKNYKIIQTGSMNEISIDAIKDDRAFGYFFSGYLKVPVSGVYTFFLGSNDGSNLIVDDKLLIDNDGGHGKDEKWNKRALEKGWHSFQLNYFQMGLAKALYVNWQAPGKQKEKIPASVLFH